MPKFLDVPSWYADNGEEYVGYGGKRIFVDNGEIIRLDQYTPGRYDFYSTSASTSAGGIYFYLEAPTSSVPTPRRLSLDVQSFVYENKFLFSIDVCRQPTEDTNSVAYFILHGANLGSNNYVISAQSIIGVYPSPLIDTVISLTYFNGSVLGASFYRKTQIFSMNGSTQAGVASTSSTIYYAPTSTGTAGQILQSNGMGAPSWTNLVKTTVFPNGSSTSFQTEFSFAYITVYGSDVGYYNFSLYDGAAPQCSNVRRAFLFRTKNDNNPSYFGEVCGIYQQEDTSLSGSYDYPWIPINNVTFHSFVVSVNNPSSGNSGTTIMYYL